MKILIRVILTCLSICLILSLCSCFAPPVPIEKELPLTPTSTAGNALVDVRIMLVTDEFVMESWSVIQELFKLSGVNAYIKTLRPAFYEDIVTRTLTSEDFYDFMEIDYAKASIYSEYFINIAPLIQDSAPNFAEWMLDKDEYKNMYDNGIPIFHFPFRESTNRLKAVAFASNELDNEGSMDLDSFYSSMENRVLACAGSTMDLVEVMAPYFATSSNVYNKDNKIVFGPVTTEFKDMLRELNSMYKKGIIPKDFRLSPPSSYSDSVVNANAGVVICEENDYEWAFNNNYSPIMLNFAQNAYSPSRYVDPNSYGVIVTGTGHEFDILRLIETCFSKEGRALLNYGINGLHSVKHRDGIIEYMPPFTNNGIFQWHEEGLTPEGMPGIYYNQWAAFDDELLNELMPMRGTVADEDFLLAPLKVSGIKYGALVKIKGALQIVQQQWWSSFIDSSKSIENDWNEYIQAMTNAGYKDILLIEHNILS